MSVGIEGKYFNKVNTGRREKSPWKSTAKERGKETPANEVSEKEERGHKRLYKKMERF